MMRTAVLATLALLLAACSSSGGISKPGSPSGGSGPTSPSGGSGSPFPVPSGGQSGGAGSDGGSTPSFPGGQSGGEMPGGGMPGGQSGEMPGGGMPGGQSGQVPGSELPGGKIPGMGERGDSGDLEEVFEKSLGDFDGEMEQERAAMERSGSGSQGSAEQREGADADTVGDASVKTGGSAGGGMASIPGAESGGGGDDAESSSQDSSGADAGAGQDEVKYEGKGDNGESSQRDGARVAKIPDDIPADGSADDQVAKQIREAAMAETDPLIREALWEEYRKHTGIKQ